MQYACHQQPWSISTTLIMSPLSLLTSLIALTERSSRLIYAFAEHISDKFSGEFHWLHVIFTSSGPIYATEHRSSTSDAAIRLSSPRVDYLFMPRALLALSAIEDWFSLELPELNERQRGQRDQDDSALTPCLPRTESSSSGILAARRRRRTGTNQLGIRCGSPRKSTGGHGEGLTGFNTHVGLSAKHVGALLEVTLLGVRLDGGFSLWSLSATCEGWDIERRRGMRKLDETGSSQ